MGQDAQGQRLGGRNGLESHQKFHSLSYLTCLVTGAAFDSEEPSYHVVRPEPFNMNFDQGDNNCGITVVDVTALHNLKYCFVMYHQDQIYWEEFQVMAPLRASNYLWPYSHIEMNQNTFQAKFQKLVQQFEGRDIVEVGALNGTWPRKE